MEISGGITFSGGWTIETPTLNTVFNVSGWGQEITNIGTITGPAPLAVFFDASETTAYQYDAFREAGYHFDFGYATPTTPGTWTYNGEPKGNQIGGPIASHVYQTPGTYIASLRAQLPSGLYQDRFVTIVVQDPDVVYAGTATVCISLAGNFTGAPAGAVTQTTVPTTAQPNTRYLFRCGEDYSATNISIPRKSVAITKSNIMIGSYGTGSRPKLQQSFPNRPPTTGVDSNASCVTILNCSLSALSINYIDYLLLHSSDTWFIPGPTAGNATVLVNDLIEYYSNPANSANYLNSLYSRNITLSEFTCYAGGRKNIHSNGSIYFTVLGCSLLPNPYGDPPSPHTLRIEFGYKVFIAHNILQPPSDITMYMKLHGSGSNPFVSFSPYLNPKVMSRYEVVADNYLMPSGSVRQFVNISPQDNMAYEFVQDVIAERNILNFVAGGAGGQVGIAFGGMRLTGRANTFNNWPNINFYGQTHVNGAGGVPSSITGPYYIPAGDPDIDNIKFFATPSPGIYPAKAGT